MTDSDLNEASNEVFNAALKQLAKEKLNANDCKIIIEKGSNKGDNFIGIVYRVVVKATERDEKDIKDKNGYSDNGNSLHIILKVAPQNAARRAQFMSRPCFLREILVYNEILPMFRAFQEARGIIPEENGFFEYAECYKTIDSDLNEALLFQDLKHLQFEMFDRHKETTFEHARLVLDALGRLHALSFALRDQEPEKLKKYSDIKDVFMDRATDNQLSDYMTSITDKTKSALDEKTDARLIQKLTEIFETKLLQVAMNCTNGKAAEPYTVLCHGDCWNNNILFKYGKDNVPNEVRLLDWQIVRYASPVTDILYYIFCCTTKALRDKHFENLLKIYHNSFSNFLKRLGSDPDKLFPFTALQDQLRKFGHYGLAMASMLLPVLTAAGEDCPDLDDLATRIEDGQKMSHEVFKSGASYNKRMRDVVIDLDRLGLL